MHPLHPLATTTTLEGDHLSQW